MNRIQKDIDYLLSRSTSFGAVGSGSDIRIGQGYKLRLADGSEWIVQITRITGNGRALNIYYVYLDPGGNGAYIDPDTRLPWSEEFQRFANFSLNATLIEGHEQISFQSPTQSVP